MPPAIPEDYGNSRRGSLVALSFRDRGCRENPAAAPGFGGGSPGQHRWVLENYGIPTLWLLFGSVGFGAGSLGFGSAGGVLGQSVDLGSLDFGLLFGSVSWFLGRSVGFCVNQLGVGLIFVSVSGFWVNWFWVDFQVNGLGLGLFFGSGGQFLN